MSTEFELKFRATPELIGAIAAAYPGGTQIVMATTYFDTPQRSLSARKWTLRHRQENDLHVCTLKTPTGDANSRHEFEVFTPDIHAAIRELEKQCPGLEALTAGGVAVSCGARFTRIAVPVALGESTAELALDQGVLINGSRELPFAEVEVELKSGEKVDAAAFAALLAGKYGLTPEHKSKHYRAMELGKEG